MSMVEAWTDLIREGWGRFRRAWPWVAGEYVGVAVLIAVGLAWTRIPEKNGWQVGLTLAVPVLVAAAFLWLQAGFARGFLRPASGVLEAKDDDDNAEQAWVAIVWGATTLLVWIAIGWLLWDLLDRADDQIWQWASYLNSKFDPHARTHWASYAHLSRDLFWAEWALRWVVVPGLLVPVGAGSAAWGLVRLPWRRVVRVWLSWKWWPMVAAWALIGEAWPQTWFESEPHGAVHAQVWRVLLKIAGAYLLGVTAWVKVLGWGAMRVNPRPRTRMDEAFLSLGLEAPAAARAQANQPEAMPASEGGAVGRPLPRGGENGSGNT